MPLPYDRTSGDYRFHVYDYANSQPWVPSAAINGVQFYSLLRDLEGLVTEGTARGVPNLRLRRYGLPILDADAARNTLALTFGGPANPAQRAPGIVLTGGVHAREWLSPTIVYLIAEYLIVNYEVNPRDRYARAIRDLVNTRRLTFVPMMNPNGHWYTVFGNRDGSRLWRKNRRQLPTTQAEWLAALTNHDRGNPPLTRAVPSPNPQHSPDTVFYQSPEYPERRDPNTGQLEMAPFNITPSPAHIGVDLNRNFDTRYWGYTPSEDPSASPPPPGDAGAPTSSDYFGPQRSSELETQNLQVLLADVASKPGGLAALIDYHAYGKFILYPTETYDRGRVDRGYRSLGRLMKQHITAAFNGGPDYDLGTPREWAGYDATGTIPERAAQAHGARAYTIELDPRPIDPQRPPHMRAPADDAEYIRFFSNDGGTIQTVFEKNIRAALALVAEGGSRWWFPNDRGAGRRFLDWDVFDQRNRLPGRIAHLAERAPG